jgi:hypothetical protein
MLPIGFVLNVWGNTIYDASHRLTGLILFVVGLALALHGVKPWRGLTDDWRTPKRVHQWATKNWDGGWKRYWEQVKLTIWGVIVLGVVLYSWRLVGRILEEPDRVTVHFSDGLNLMLVWALLPVLTEWAEPKDPPKSELLERLSSRIRRAVITRTVANSAGIYFAGITIYALVFTSRPALLVPIAVTLGVAMIAAGHKTWARLRKLSTQLHRNIQTLKRDLAMIPGSGEKAEDKRDAARRSWDAVQVDLWTNVDTGYGILSVPFLPLGIVNELRESVKRTIEALEINEDAAKDVLADLGKIQDACFSRIDSVV